MKKAFIPIFLAFLSIGNQVSAQLPALSVVSLTVDEDTIDMGMGEYTFTYFVKVVNVGNASYTGNISLEASYSADPGNVWGWGSTNISDMQPGDTLFFTPPADDVTVAPFRYSGGENIILVWPHASSEAQVPDTNNIHVWILNFTSRSNPQPLESRVKVFPNPVKDMIRFNWKESGHPLEYVRLTNLSGQEVFSTKNEVLEMAVDGLPQGLYLLEIHYSDGLRGFFRISKD